ncbi:MAG TPA: ATP-binding protein [Puia sp.]
MIRKIIFCLSGFLGLAAMAARANAYTDDEARTAWARLKQQAITEGSFVQVCDLLQDVGKTNIRISYEILAEYVPMVRATGNRERLHILLMSNAKARESLTDFAEAETLYRQARENAAGDYLRYDEALVGTVLLFAEWGKTDSLEIYVKEGKEAASRHNDKESLSFLYTFGAVANMADTVAMGRGLRTAMELAEDLPNKNALFTARYNYASIYSRYSPQQQATIFQSLLALAADSTLTHKYKLYERSAFIFRNPVPNIYLQLMQVNLLLADYDNAWKFGQLLYDAVVRPNPEAPQAPFFTSELAIVKAYQGQFDKASALLDESRRLFKVPEEKIGYPSYFLAAGMIAEHRGQEEQALRYYSTAYRMGGMEGLHLMPSELYFAQALIRLHRLEEASKVLDSVRLQLPARTYTAYGFYFYRAYTQLLRARGDYAGYGKALEQYYSIKDSLASLNHYRAIEEIEARVRLRDKEQQIFRLREEQEERIRNTRKERIFIGVSALLVSGLVLLWILQKRKQHRIGIMEGVMDAEQRERNKIAGQLHDEVAGMLSLATLNLSSALEKGLGDEQSEQKLEKTQETLQIVGVTVRELSHRLTPLVIEKYGLYKAVEDMVGSINLSGKLHVGLVIVGLKDTDRYSEGLLHDLYRMLQELLQNIVRHAHAENAMVQLVEHGDGLSIMVEDDGVGIGEQAKGGMGLKAIRTKITYLNGKMEIGRKQDRGTLIVIELPIENK